MTGSIAEAATWRRGEIDGGVVQALAQDPASGRIYAAGATGLVFASEDGGESWRRVNRELLDPRGLADIEVAANGAIVAIQITLSKVLRSNDGGATWAELPVHIGSVEERRVVRDAIDPSRLYLPAGSFGLLRSDDSGTTWENVAQEINAPDQVREQVAAFVQSPVQPQLLYVFTRPGGLYRSPDGGESWTFLGAPIGGPPVQLVAHPGDADVFFALTSEGLFRSSSRGESWQELDPGVGEARFDRLGFTPGGALLVGIADGVGMLRSSDGGDTFSPVPLDFNPVLLTDFLAAGGSSRILASARSGVLASADDGLTWSPANTGLGGIRARDLVAAAGEGGRVYLVHDGGFARSEDRGATWTPIELGEAGTFPVWVVPSLRSAPTVYAAIHPLPGGVVAASTDAGGTWSLGTPFVGRFYHAIRSIAVDRFDDRHLVVGLLHGELWESGDGGVAWRRIYDFPELSGVDPASIVVAGDQVVVALTEFPSPTGTDDVVVIRSDDGGVTWSETFRQADLSATPHLAIDPADPLVLYLETNDDVHRSLDGGRAWQLVAGLPPGGVRDIATDSARGDVVVVAKGAADVVRSEDRGLTWEPLPPLPAGELVRQVASAAEGTIHAVTDSAIYTLVPDDEACEGAHRLCLNGDRFLLEVAWKDFLGGSGSGVARALTSDTGAFWFFDPENVELVVKVLDARAVNGHFWVFYGSLTNVEFRLRITDRSTGEVVEYVNPSGQFASRGDTAAFPTGTGAPVGSAGLPASRRLAEGARRSAAPEGTCVADATSLCLADGRFRVQVAWQDFQGGSGAGQAAPIPGSSDTGTFWFFDPANVELVVKVLDARPVNGHFWVFYGALSNVGYTLSVTDRETGEAVRYENTPGTFASRGDTAAFPG